MHAARYAISIEIRRFLPDRAAWIAFLRALSLPPSAKGMPCRTSRTAASNPDRDRSPPNPAIAKDVTNCFCSSYFPNTHVLTASEGARTVAGFADAGLSLSFRKNTSYVPIV